MNLKQKIDKILIDNKLSGAKFAQIIGVQKSGMYKIIRGETKKLQKETAEAINKHFPEYSYEWLMIIKDTQDTNVDVFLEKDGVKISVKEIAIFLVENQELFMRDKVLSLVIDKKVEERLNKKLNDIIDNHSNNLNFK